MTLYLRDATHIDADTLAIRRGHLAVEPGPTGGVSFVERVPDRAEVVDCGGKLGTRTFAIAHHHAYSALARGLPAPARVPRPAQIFGRASGHIHEVTKGLKS